MTHASDATVRSLPIWVEFVASIVRTAIGLVFIFWLLSLVPVRPDPSAILPMALLIVGTVFYIVILRWQLRRVFRAQYPGLLAVESLILSAALFLAIFSAVYVIVDGGHPGSFSEELNHFSALYFALTVLATVGFGDITPVTQMARGVVMVQMALGLTFIAVIIKVFIGTAQRARELRGRNQSQMEGNS